MAKLRVLYHCSDCNALHEADSNSSLGREAIKQGGLNIGAYTKIDDVIEWLKIKERPPADDLYTKIFGTNQKPETTDYIKDILIRRLCLEYAIKSSSGDEGETTVKKAQMFENYIMGKQLNG